MNILHHKSYHVYNKKNIEKVKKDEAEAEKQEKVKQDRITLAESEARLEILRKRANANLPNTEKDTKPTQHINLFQDLVLKGNEEHEQDLKEEQEKWNKQVTMYLDKGAEKKDEPWYNKNNPEKYKDLTTFKSKSTSKKKKSSIKLLEDPLDIINTRLKSKEKKEYKQEKKYKHEKSKSTSNDTSSIEALRAKRLEREKKEKMRVNQLYLGQDYVDDKEKISMDERKRGYNSQFNRIETEQAHKKKRR